MSQGGGDDFSFLENKASPAHRCCNRGVVLKVFIAAACVTLFILLVVALSRGAATEELNAYCLYPLGGSAAPTSDVSISYVASKECAQVYKDYIKVPGGRYWKDTEVAIQTAREVLIDSGRFSDGNYTQMAVFDIDETVLSNMEEIERGGFGLFDDKIWAEWVLEARAPAIEPSLQLIKELRAKGFSIAFLTGRSEERREATEKNLEVAGYGKKCPQKKEPAAGEMCYYRLILRDIGDSRDAAIFKPEKRQELTDEGFEIVAAFGDQWSDLLAAPRPLGMFKMPNPFYYIA